jgi:hypothetical protein
MHATLGSLTGYAGRRCPLHSRFRIVRGEGFAELRLRRSYIGIAWT